MHFPSDLLSEDIDKIEFHFVYTGIRVEYLLQWSQAALESIRNFMLFDSSNLGQHHDPLALVIRVPQTVRGAFGLATVFPLSSGVNRVVSFFVTVVACHLLVCVIALASGSLVFAFLAFLTLLALGRGVHLVQDCVVGRGEGRLVHPFWRFAATMFDEKCKFADESTVRRDLTRSSASICLASCSRESRCSEHRRHDPTARHTRAPRRLGLGSVEGEREGEERVRDERGEGRGREEGGKRG